MQTAKDNSAKTIRPALTYSIIQLFDYSIIQFRFLSIFNIIHSTVSEMFYFSFSPDIPQRKRS